MQDAIVELMEFLFIISPLQVHLSMLSSFYQVALEEVGSRHGVKERVVGMVQLLGFLYLELGC